MTMPSARHLAVIMTILPLLGGGCISVRGQQARQSLPPEFEGAWERVALTVDGDPKDTVPSSMDIRGGLYYVESSCDATGRIVADDDRVAFYPVSDNCPERIAEKIEFDYAFSDDGDTLVLSGKYGRAPLDETYRRSDKED